MKALAVLLILAAIGYFGYNHFLKPLTGEEQEVQAIEKRYDAALQEYLQAVRKAGGLGMDTIGDVDAAIRKIRSTKTALLNLKRRLKNPSAVEKAKELETEMRRFYAKNELIWF
jgi:hypothetical protein